MFIKGVKDIIRYSFVAMFSTDVNHERNNQSIFEEQQAKLQKIQELTNMLKDTNENLTICEEILTTYLRKRLKVLPFFVPSTMTIPTSITTVPPRPARVPTTIPSTTPPTIPKK
ncbi:uncharacterized protein V1477_012200 [Vespula maculifrons]|uniref:Uncharacterized protein n=1 Tax=Vespula maculifrons TaxID=7453 RepID=A0ABD2BWT3_VESMC